MSRLYIVFLIFFIIQFSCKSSFTEAEVDALQTLVDNKSFKIESQWAQPQASYAMQQVLNSGVMGPGNSTGNINLNGNANFLIIKGDSVQSYLPYFGERQMNVDYGGRDGAIKLEGLMEDYKVEVKKDESRNISFRAAGNRENYSVYIQLFPNLTSNILINSTSRFPIRYRGNVEATEIE